MVSLRFPFLFSQPKKHPNGISRTITSRSFPATTTTVACALAAGAAAFAGIAATRNSKNPKQDNPFIQNALNLLFSNHLLAPWASLSLADPSPSVVETKTGAAFPSVIFESRRLLGIGLRKKTILGLKNIDVYAFGNHIYWILDYKHFFLDLIYGIMNIVCFMSEQSCLSVKFWSYYTGFRSKNVVWSLLITKKEITCYVVITLWLDLGECFEAL